MAAPDLQFNAVSVLAKANVYFDGGVISHTILLADGKRKTLGVIRPGTYHFNTDASELMEIVDGACQVTIDGTSRSHPFGAGTHFTVPGKGGFQIVVESGLCQYICSFLD